MLFKKLFVCESLLLSIPEDEAVFCFTAPHPIRVVLRNPKEHEKAMFKSKIMCDAFCDKNPAPNVRRMFENLANGRLPKGSIRKQIPPEAADEDRILRPAMLPIPAMPNDLRNFLESIFDDLVDYAERTVSTVRWRLDRPQAAVPLQSILCGELFSFDGTVWHEAPQGARLTLDIIGYHKISNYEIEEVGKLVQEGGSEPLAHVLFREAWSQRTENRRSALLIGYAAAEVGIKRHVLDMIPQSQGLVEDLPSPPIGKLLKFVSKLPSRSLVAGNKPNIPESITKKMNAAMQLRNEIAHRGDAALNHKALEEFLLATKDLLWLLDYHAGKSWALTFIRPETRQELGV
jgi:hypothetical protein